MDLAPKLIYIFLSKINRLHNHINGIGFGGFPSIIKEVESISKFIPEGKIVIDVGGNIGDYSEQIINNFNPNELHIFEPSSKNVDKLKKRFENNKNVRINGIGLSNESNKSMLYSNTIGSGLGSVYKRRLDHFNIKFDETETIELMRFDKYWKDNEKTIDIFKIDVEGHELKVLEGIGDLIKSIKVIQFEFGGCNIDSKTYFQDFFYFFKKNGFQMFRISPYKPIPIERYDENDENFLTTNFLSVNQSFININ